ncbi:MAG: hypothetical protein GY832_15820 [Chloroflexi bacterium]|nr:hypothetical protein [Chloroflexota bacterium]
MNATELKRHKRELYSRTPIVGRFIRQWAVEALVKDGSVGAVRMLAEAVVQSDDKRVRDIALDALRKLTEWRRVSAACAVWAELRHPDLTTLLMEREWVASKPPEVRVLTALKVGQIDVVTGGGEKIVEPLAWACRDADPVIAERARQALRELRRKEAQQALCCLLIERDHPYAQEAAVAAKYKPKNEQQRALFFFLTEQWDRYEGLDFDRQLLRAAYAMADAELRRRIQRRLRAAGRTDFLTVIAGDDYLDRAAEATHAELELLVQTLITNSEWPLLWKLVFEVPFTWSVRIVTMLTDSGWTPDRGEDPVVLSELISLTRQGLPTSEQEIDQLFPPALLQAQARVPGRINDIAFSPARPVIAIGTGVRKVALWDYQRAEREHLLSGFDHSIGHVAFTGDNTLLCAERTNDVLDPCAIYGWSDSWDTDQPARLGNHDGSVTAIVPLGDSRALSAGRDSQVILWDTHSWEKVASRQSKSWARAMRVSPDSQQVALLAKGFKLMALPQLNREVGVGYSHGMLRSAAFSDGKTLIVGKFNGDVFVYRHRAHRNWFTGESMLTRHQGRVEGVEMLHDRSIVVTAGSEGVIRFISLDDHEIIGEVQDPLGQVTSLHVSPDASFMAVGNSKASMSLWDLRVLDAQSLLERSFGQTTPDLLSTLDVLMDNENLPLRARLALKFTDCVLRHRFRFDIELGEAPTIMMGEFDIEIE